MVILLTAVSGVTYMANGTMTWHFLLKNYKINLYERNSQIDTKLKPVFAIDSQTHHF